MELRSRSISPKSDEGHYLNQNSECSTSPNKKCDVNYVHAPIDKFGVAGRWFRHMLLDGILVGTPVILTIQKHRTPARNTIMKILSFLGTEDFYTLLFLCLTWLFDSRLARLFGILMGIGFYVTGFLKTMLCLPRPPSPPVIPLENAFDWALPSHHSLLGVIMPWYIWLYATLHYELSTINMSIICSLIVLWSFGVLLSRLYLGVHSPADIVCGGIVGVVILSLWMQVDDIIDYYISLQQLEPQLKLIAFTFFLLCIHPITEPGNPSFIDTCVLHGVVSGIILARSQRSRLLGMQSLLELSEDISLIDFLKCSFARVLLGGIIIIVLRVSLKFIFLSLTKALYRLIGIPFFNSSTYRKTMRPNSKHHNADFKIPPIYRTNPKSDLCDDSDSSGSGEGMSGDDDVNDEELDSPKWFTFIQICNAIHSLATKSNSDPWDVTIPVKLIVYCIIGYTAVEVVPQAFTLVGI